MLQKSSARKGFCAEDLRIWRVKWYIYNAGSVVFTMFPAWVYFFEKSFRVPKVVPKVSIFIDISQLLFISKTIHYLVPFPSGFCAVLINIHSTLLE